MKEDADTLVGLHITIAGDSGLALSYLPYAKAKLRELLVDGDDYQAKSYTPQAGVVIRMRVIDDERFVHIEAVRGCTDRRGFLLSRSFADPRPYNAHYTDGLIENINPTEGLPRPEGDIAVRTKGYKVPPELRPVDFTRRSASKYSGLMRLVVGCYHLAGRDSPFLYAHTKTHGIVQKTVRVNNVDVERYWVVEVSADGVFAAPITNTGKCCDSWSVKKYMPIVPPATTPPTSLSLSGRFTVADTRVKVLVSAAQMATVYASGTPFYPDHGWAFSASGAEAQAVLQRYLTLPAPHYKCSRWKITFTAVGENLAATLTEVEHDQVATFKVNNVVWIPTSAGVWTGSAGAGAGTPNPITTFPTQDAPVAVYYSYETEFVLRWSLRQTSDPGSFSQYNDQISAEVAPPITVCPWSPTSPLTDHIPFSGEALVIYDLGSLTSGWSIPAHTRQTYGFSCPAFSHVAVTWTATVQTTDLIVVPEVDSPVIPYGPNSYALAPECYYINAVGTLVTNCSSVFETQARDRLAIWWDRFTGTQTQANTSTVVLFAEEREAWLGVNQQGEAFEGTKASPYDTSEPLCRESRLIKIDAGLCPYEEPTYQQHSWGHPCGTGVEMYPPVFTNTAYTSQSRNASATLALADYIDTAEMAIGPAPLYVHENYNLATFLECNALKLTATSNVKAMHGNLYYSDARLTPPNQSGNKVYLLNNVQVVAGGFAAPADPVGFVGRA